MYSLAHQATDWFVQRKEVHALILKGPDGYAQDFVISMMVPNQNSVVFYCKTAMWSCLSGTTCSHVFSRNISCFGAYSIVHFPRILQRHLVDLCCNLSLQTCWVWSILSTIGSESHADMMVVTFSTVAFCSQPPPPLCQFPMGCPSR